MRAAGAQSGVKWYYPLREPWHLLCHGGKTPANRLPLERPRALWARSGVQGHCPWGVAHETADGYVAADDHP